MRASSKTGSDPSPARWAWVSPRYAMRVGIEAIEPPVKALAALLRGELVTPPSVA